MTAAQFDPAEVINLESSDAEPAQPTKKRSLEDTEEISTRPRDGEEAPRDSKRAKTGLTHDADEAASEAESLSAEEGEIDEDDDAGKDMAAPTSSLPPSTQARPTVAGWNPSISKTVLRTSLGAPASSASGPEPPQPKPLQFYHKSTTFQLPNLPEKKEGSWFDRFKDWVREFLKINPTEASLITPAVTQLAYSFYVEKSSLKPKKRRSAKQAAKEMESTGELTALLESAKPPGQTGGAEKAPDLPVESDDGAAPDNEDDQSDSEVEYEPVLGKTEIVQEPPINGDAAPSFLPIDDDSADSADEAPVAPAEPIETSRAVPIGSDALDQQRKYFPSATDPAKMCLLCGSERHLATSCPSLICQFCGSHDHADLRCPTRERCGKCRQFGHQAGKCTEKLALTKEEGLVCAICDSSEHTETKCTQVWRSFHPVASTIQKVTFIPATCAACGSNQHFFSDCGLCKDASNTTWSVKNRDLYLDPDCGVSSIEQAAGGYDSAQPSRAPEMRIRGHAARTTNVHYSSDDSDTEFLGRKSVKQRAPLGQIRMASNIQMPGGASSRGDRSSRGRGQFSALAQPPLPPGPPPPRPAPGQGSFGYPPPPGVATYATSRPPPPPSLPAKPPAKDYRNVPSPPQVQAPRGGKSFGGGGGGNASNGPQGSKSKGGQRGGRGGKPPFRGGRGRGRGRGK